MWWKPHFNVTLTFLVFTEGLCLPQLILAFYLILYFVSSDQDLSTFSVPWAYKWLKSFTATSTMRAQNSHPFLWRRGIVVVQGADVPGWLFNFSQARCAATYWILHISFPWMSSIQSLEAGPRFDSQTPLDAGYQQILIRIFPKNVKTV